MKLGLVMGTGTGAGIEIDMDLIREAEDLGFDSVWTSEAWGSDAISSASWVLAQTTKIKVGTGIIQMAARTPACAAMTALTLQALSGNRFILGVGPSGPQVIEGFHGVPYSLPLTRIKEIISICRMAWQREKLEYDGRVFTLPLPASEGTGLGKPLKIINHPVRDDIPIYVASLGSRSVEETAATANGWLPFMVYPERMDRVWGDALQAGAARRDPTLGDLDVVAGGLVAIGEDAAQYRDWARPMAALYIGGMGAKGKNFYNDLCGHYGFAGEAQAVQDAYLDGRRDEAMAALPEELIENSNLCGDDAYILDRLAAYKEAGVTSLNAVSYTHLTLPTNREV